MSRTVSRLLLASLIALMLYASAHAGNWSQWRGPTGDHQ
jgi:hypothetical protein